MARPSSRTQLVGLVHAIRGSTVVMPGRYTMLPTDIALKTDASFAEHVKRYAQDQDVFFAEFAAAYGKLLSLGCPTTCCPANATTEASPEQVASADFREHAMHGSIEHCQAAVKNGADVHSLEANSGRTALHKAAFWNHTHMLDWMLGELKMDPNVADYNDDTALHDAARFGHNEVVQKLLANGADKSLKNKDGQTAGQVAAAYDKQETVKLLE